MEVVRAATCDDIDDLYDLIQRASYGLTSLKLSKEQLLERLEWSQFAFSRKTERPRGEPYVLVMEDLTRGAIVGTSCIFAKTGGYEPLYVYKTVTVERASEELGVRRDVQYLELERIHDGPTEIGSLFLMPEYRGKGRGRLLSMSRFILLAQRPDQFAEEVIAEMRGVCDEDGNCPFWDAIASHFFQIEFPVADAMSTVSKQFIEDLMPQHPIYLDLLPKKATKVIGTVHEHTRPALAMLQGEGFQSRGYFDIFDGGPIVHCDRDSIASVSACQMATLAETGELDKQPSQIVGTAADAFRSANVPLQWLEEGQVKLPDVAAIALRIKIGDPIWVLPPRDPAGNAT